MTGGATWRCHVTRGHWGSDFRALLGMRGRLVCGESEYRTGFGVLPDTKRFFNYSPLSMHFQNSSCVKQKEGNSQFLLKYSKVNMSKM